MPGDDVAIGHTIPARVQRTRAATRVAKPGGPALLLLERACVEPVEEGGGSRASRLAKPDARHHGSPSADGLTRQPACGKR